MANATFDTLHAAKTLTQAGFAPPQAEAITDTIRAAFSDSVATKTDIAELRAEMATRFEALDKHLWLGAAGMVATIAALIRLLSG